MNKKGLRAANKIARDMGCCHSATSRLTRQNKEELRHCCICGCITSADRKEVLGWLKLEPLPPAIQKTLDEAWALIEKEQ